MSKVITTSSTPGSCDIQSGSSYYQTRVGPAGWPLRSAKYNRKHYSVAATHATRHILEHLLRVDAPHISLAASISMQPAHKHRELFYALRPIGGLHGGGLKLGGGFGGNEGLGGGNNKLDEGGNGGLNKGQSGQGNLQHQNGGDALRQWNGLLIHLQKNRENILLSLGGGDALSGDIWQGLNPAHHDGGESLLGCRPYLHHGRDAAGSIMVSLRNQHGLTTQHGLNGLKTQGLTLSGLLGLDLRLLHKGRRKRRESVTSRSCASGHNLRTVWTRIRSGRRDFRRSETTFLNIRLYGGGRFSRGRGL